MTDHTPPTDPPLPSGDSDETPPDMSASLLARLFAVPLLIVAMIVGCSVMVVLLFGWISTSQEESIEKLLARIEVGTGEKVMDVAMMPQDREVWQAAMELSRRLQSDDPRDLPPEKRPDVAHRLAKILDHTRTGDQTEMAQEMQQFLLTALGWLREPESVGVVEAFASDESQSLNVRRHAVGALVLMRTLPEARGAYPSLLPLLDSPEPVLRVAGVVAIGVLADRGDAVAIKALSEAYRSDDREVTWNATIALARLGAHLVTPMLTDMLDRSYWEQVELDLPDVPSGQGEPRRLTPTQVEGYLVLTIEAAQTLGDPSLQAPVKALMDDTSSRVRERASQASSAWPSSAPSPMSAPAALADIIGEVACR